MKISEEQKKETKRKIIEAAVELMIKQGYKNTSMREIAKKAEIGDATIYNYFSSKEKILYGYFEIRLEDTLSEIKSIKEFENYTLKEKIQELLETNIGHLQKDREFVQEAFKLAFLLPGSRFNEASKISKTLTENIFEYFRKSEEKGEIANQPFLNMISNMFFWDLYLGIILYWLNDQSESFSNTTRLIDISLDLLVSVLKSDIITKGLDLFSFFIKNHMFNAFGKINEIVNLFNINKGASK